MTIKRFVQILQTYKCKFPALFIFWDLNHHYVLCHRHEGVYFYHNVSTKMSPPHITGYAASNTSLSMTTSTSKQMACHDSCSLDIVRAKLQRLSASIDAGIAGIKMLNRPEGSVLRSTQFLEILITHQHRDAHTHGLVNACTPRPSVLLIPM